MWKLLGGMVIVAGIVVAWPYLQANSANPWPEGWDPDQDVGLYVAETSGAHSAEFLLGAKQSGFRRSWTDDGSRGEFRLEVDAADGLGSTHTTYVRSDDQTWWHPDNVGFDDSVHLGFLLESPYHGPGMMVCSAFGPVRISGVPTDLQKVCDFVHHGFSVAWRESEDALELQLVPHAPETPPLSSVEMAKRLSSLGGEVRWAGNPLVGFRFRKEGDRLVAKMPLAVPEGERVLRTHIAVNYNQGSGGKQVIVTLDHP